MISTHILDTSRGIPAANVVVTLYKTGDFKQSETEWEKIKTGTTNADGRFVFDCPRVAAHYKIEFDIDSYYAASNEKHFFVFVPAIFLVEDTTRNYHVPLLLNPYGYSTYRGS